MDRRSPFRASLIAAALASVAGLAHAAVTDNSGSRVNSNTGQCTSHVSGTNCAGPMNTPAPALNAPSSAAPSGSTAFAPPPPRSDIAALAPAPAPTTSGAMPPARNGYVIDNSGGALRAVDGGCMTSNATPVTPEGVPQCGGVIATAPMVAPAPATSQPQASAQPEQPREIPLQRITLDTDTTFGFDSAALTQQGKDQLNNVVDAARNQNVARLRIHVTGYTDRIGSDDYNLKLSADRAAAVRNYFVQAGLPADVITTQGRGKANPVVQCQGMKGESLIQCLRPNRRSEVEFAALERAEPNATQQAPADQNQSQPSQGWEPGTDTGTPH